eukprot:scaffold20125_cov64-Cyclotella_meneghiniana.AAC.5
MATEKWLSNINSTIIINEPVKTKVFIYGGFGGRFDQEMACINALHVWGQKKTFQYTSLAMYGEETCAFLLPALPTVNEIRIPYPDYDERNDDTSGHGIGEGPSCGLIPLGGRCDKVITTGLKWNLDGNMPLEFGGLVSSSNRIMNEVVTVETSSAMIFTTEMIKVYFYLILIFELNQVENLLRKFVLREKIGPCFHGTTRIVLFSLATRLIHGKTSLGNIAGRSLMEFLRVKGFRCTLNLSVFYPCWRVADWDANSGPNPVSPHPIPYHTIFLYDTVHNKQQNNDNGEL